jgi:hypothetical protein
VIKDATRCVDSDTTIAMTQEMEKYGVEIIESENILETLDKPIYFDKDDDDKE